MAPKASPQPEAPPNGRLCFDLPPLPLERLAFPPPYEALWAEVALDLPERDLTAQMGNAQILARVVKRWNLTIDGAPAPITEATLLALADQASPLFLWLTQEWVTRRLRPLAAPPTPTNGHSSPPPTT